VSNNQVVRADFAMKVGRMDQIVEVSAGLPPIATDDATLSETIATQQTQRSAVEWPRCAATGDDHTDGDRWIENAIKQSRKRRRIYRGRHARIQNGLSLDGISIMSNLITEATFHPNVDAVQEVQVQTGTYPAQYGGYLGVQINATTKSGTNSLHGSVFEFFAKQLF